MAGYLVLIVLGLFVPFIAVLGYLAIAFCYLTFSAYAAAAAPASMIVRTIR